MARRPLLLLACCALMGGFGVGVAVYAWRSADPMAGISPAAGGGEAVSATEGHGGGEGGGEGEGTPKHKAANGKVVSGDPELPNVTIGGAQVVTSRMAFDHEIATATPPSLQNAEDSETMRHRMRFTPFSHNPTLGPEDAAITVIEMTDFSCQPCMHGLQLIDKVMEASPGKIRLIAMHDPVNPLHDINLPAFYGKVAQRGGVFWAYRKALESLKDPTPETYFDTLLAAGMDRTMARRLLTTEARRFYRELDADATLSHQVAPGAPPHYFVNGIHVGENGVGLDKLADVISYETTRPADNFGYFK